MSAEVQIARVTFSATVSNINDALAEGGGGSILSEGSGVRTVSVTVLVAEENVFEPRGAPGPGAAKDAGDVLMITHGSDLTTDVSSSIFSRVTHPELDAALRRLAMRNS